MFKRPMPVGSFQQQVFNVQVPGTGEAFLKKITSNYSWWTFDECDVYYREKTSHAIMAALTGYDILLSADDGKREFVTKALPKPNLSEANIKPLIHAILDGLAAMRSRRDTSLDKLTASNLATGYFKKGTQAGVCPRLLDEVCSFLIRWEGTYGSEVCYVHGDLHWGNILEAPDGLLYPFDYEEAIESLPAFDGANISSLISKPYGDEWYQYFKQQYQNRFEEELISLEDWHRFRRLRDWIVACYLKQCCDALTREKAKAFLFATAP
jgi:hypothetical protein